MRSTCRWKWRYCAETLQQFHFDVYFSFFFHFIYYFPLCFALFCVLCVLCVVFAYNTWYKFRSRLQKSHSKTTIISRLLTLRASLPNNVSSFVSSFVALFGFYLFVLLLSFVVGSFAICICRPVVVVYSQIIIVFTI